MRFFCALMLGRLLAFGDLGGGRDRALAGVDGEGHISAGLRQLALAYSAVASPLAVLPPA